MIDLATPWGGLRAIDFLRRTHGGTWTYHPKERASYLHHESGRRVYRAIPMEGHGDTPSLWWADTSESAEHAKYS